MCSCYNTINFFHLLIITEHRSPTKIWGKIMSRVLEFFFLSDFKELYKSKFDVDLPKISRLDEKIMCQPL